MNDGPIAGVILAAGASSRMGTNKLFLELGGETVLRRAVTTAVQAGLEPVLLVVGPGRDQIATESSGLDCTLIDNFESAAGINTSLRTGIGAVPDDAAGAVVLLADMPFVTPEMLRLLVQRFRAGSAPLAISLYGDVLAPPMLYGRALFPELRALQGEGCGKQVVRRHRAEALELKWPESALADLDVPEDVARARARIQGG